MTTTTSGSSFSGAGEVIPRSGGFVYKTIAIYPKFADVGDALLVLKKEGFTDDQISLLGREQEHWQEKLGHEWSTLKTTKGALGGAAMGAIPGLVLVTGIALTGGVGLLVAGPMVAAMSALGMGSLAGGVMGAASGDPGIAEKIPDVEEEVADAISQGRWVIVVHSYTEVEAAHARALLPNGRIDRENEPRATGPSAQDAELVDMKKLGKVVAEALESIAKISALPPLEVMRNIEGIDGAELKHAAQEAIKKVATATDLDTAQITDIFKANAGASMNDIVGRLREQSRVNRSAW
jgi:hypothetical protein